MTRSTIAGLNRLFRESAVPEAGRRRAGAWAAVAYKCTKGSVFDTPGPHFSSLDNELIHSPGPTLGSDLTSQQ